MKTIFKKIIYLLAYLFNHNYDSKIVYYHDVGTKYTNMGTDMMLFLKHIDIINKCGYKIVPAINARQGQVMLCFDDGWKGLYDHKNIFIQNNLTPTVFIAVDLIGKDGYMTKQQIIELQDAGFKFECHTWSHKNLTKFTDQELIHELKDSKEKLEQQFEHPITSICYPQGRFSKHIHKLCKEYGFEKQYSSICGGYYDLEDKELICRNCAQYLTPHEFKWMLNSTSHFFRSRFIKQQVAGNF